MSVSFNNKSGEGSSFSESPDLHVISIIAFITLNAATILVSTHDNAISAESELAIIAPEGVASGDVEVLSACSLKTVISLC